MVRKYEKKIIMVSVFAVIILTVIISSFTGCGKYNNEFVSKDISIPKEATMVKSNVLDVYGGGACYSYSHL